MRTETYYIKENEDVLDFFAKKNIRLSKSIKSQIGFISEKTNNNYVGYYQFKDQEQFYKFFIIPKIHSEEVEKEKAFTHFLAEYYRLNNKYEGINPKDLKGNVIDFSFEKFDDLNSYNIQDFITHKYKWALKILDKFFRKHVKTRARKEKYASQSVRHRIDLAQNIRSLDKSNIHQVKTQTEFFSIIALIAQYALKQFKSEKITNLEEGEVKEKLSQIANSVLSKIYKRYKSDRQFTFKDRDIITNKIAKIFKKSSELKRVYEALLILIGMEHFQSQETSQEVRKLENMVALFFRPEDLFEWIVYDKLTEVHPTGNILKDKLGKGTSKNYTVLHGQGNFLRKSNPDFVVIESELVTIIDAKWKTLSKIEDVQFSDISKLKRDAEIRKNDFSDKEIKCCLVFPKIDFDFEDFNPIKRNFDEGFEFEIREEEV